MFNDFSEGDFVKKDLYEPYTRKAHYYETDRMGIVHHSNYIRWFEEARVDFLEKIGLPYDALEKSGILLPVLGVSCDYIQPVVFDEQFSITIVMSHFSGVKLTIEYVLKSVGDGAVKARGESRHCFADPSLKPIRLKRTHPEIYRIFERLT